MEPGHEYNNPFNQPNPYESPEQPYYDPQQHAVQDEMHYMQAYKFVFDHPNWVANLLLGTVAQIIPVVGPIVFMGYVAEVIESLHRYPGHQYPDFNFDKFGDYLMRGLWPFLVAMVASLVVMPVAMMMPLMLPLMALVDSPAVHVVAFLLWIVLYFASFVVMGFVMVPMLLRSALMQNFPDAFSWTFISDFIGKMWMDMVVAFLFHAVMATLVVMVGLMLFCIGYLPAMVLALFAQWHLMYQLYEVYLSRGGQPIPLKEPAAA